LAKRPGAGVTTVTPIEPFELHGDDDVFERPVELRRRRLRLDPETVLVFGACLGLRNFLSVAIFSTHAKVLSKVVRVAGSSAMVTDLQAKVEKYETKATQCEESARQATDEPQRAFYQVLANYYGALATDFRQVIEKRKAA
jgi:hypothetical protein